MVKTLAALTTPPSVLRPLVVADGEVLVVTVVEPVELEWEVDGGAGMMTGVTDTSGSVEEPLSDDPLGMGG